MRCAKQAKREAEGIPFFPNFLDHWVTSQSEGKALVSETSIKSLFLKEQIFFLSRLLMTSEKGRTKTHRSNYLIHFSQML